MLVNVYFGSAKSKTEMRLDDGAWVETYLYLSQQAAEGRYSAWHENALRWEQRLVRDAGAWRIAAHRVRNNRVEADSES